MQKGIDCLDNGCSLSALEKPPCPLLLQIIKSCFSLIMEDFPDSQGPPAENNVALIPQDKKKDKLCTQPTWTLRAQPGTGPLHDIWTSLWNTGRIYCGRWSRNRGRIELHISLKISAFEASTARTAQPIAWLEPNQKSFAYGTRFLLKRHRRHY